MAKKSGLGQSFFIAGYDLSGDVGSFDRISSPVELLLATGINKSAVERIPGKRSGEISFRNFFNDAANQQFAALKAPPTADVVAVLFISSTLGEVAAGLLAKQMNFDWDRNESGDLLGLVQCLGSGKVLEWGESVTAGKITHSSSGSSTGKVESQTTAGCALYLQVMSVASGTPTFVVQDSSDTTNGIDGSWATLGTFTIQSQGAERITVSGTVEKAVRATTTGSFSNAVFAMMIRRGESVDVEGY